MTIVKRYIEMMNGTIDIKSKEGVGSTFIVTISFEIADPPTKPPAPDAGRIPIIAVTANAFDEDIQKCMNAGMNAHVAKPLDIDRLIEVIAALCSEIS